MAIEIRQPGLAKLYGQAAKLAGEAQAAREQEREARRMQTELARLDYRRQIRELDHIWDIEAYNRSKAWALEKMEMTSRHNFELAEQKRLEKQAEFDTAIKEIDRRVQVGELSEEEANKLRTMVSMRQAGVSVSPTFWREPRKPAEDLLTQYMQWRLAGGQGTFTEFAEQSGQEGAVAELPQPRTQAEYDAIPPGTRFMDTDKKIKIKKGVAASTRKTTSIRETMPFRKLRTAYLPGGGLMP